MQRLKWTHAAAGLLLLGGGACTLMSGCSDKGDDSSTSFGDDAGSQDSTTPADASASDTSAGDANASDASVVDAATDGSARDGSIADGSPTADSAAADAGAPDATPVIDAATQDASQGQDASTHDAGTADASTLDASADSGAPDATADATAEAGSDAGADAAIDAGAEAGKDAGVDAGPCAAGGSTTACFDSLGAGCLDCASSSGCFDPTMQGGTCEMTTGTATLLSGTLADNKTCQEVVGSSSISNSDVCLLTLGEIFASKCAATLQETPCLCGAADAAQCLAGTTPPLGPLYDLYQCDYDSTNVSTIQQNITNQAFGAGQANALVQCAAAFGCNSCFGM